LVFQIWVYTMLVYAVRNKETKRLVTKYNTSNPFYYRLNDARAARNAQNHISNEEYETVQSEVEWEVV